MTAPDTSPAAVAVVIPALDEEREIRATLAALLERPPCPLEVVVADGGSRDRTAAIAAELGARVVAAPRGRGAQMNAGAGACAAPVVLFLHADTRLGRPHLEALLAALGSPGVSHGSFPIRIDAPGAAYRLISAVANLRTRLDRTPYGDQAMFVRRAAFAAVGGFPEVPVLEDVILARRLRATGRYALLAGPPVLTSARRWERHGLLRTTLRNWLVRTLWELGASPDRLRALRGGGPGRV